ncbi:MAG: V-type ATP synthase subunit I, partial [Candidatus Neomarinimicrobiota bacterium]
VYLEGYCPEKNLNSFKDLAEKEGWGYLADDPDDPAEVPTLISKPRWLKMVDPIFSFMGTIPGYQEFDISFWFLSFFSLFFAILVGDAGYGLVFLIAAILLRRKHKQAPPEIFRLVYVLSGALIVWGAITGTWFGFETVARLPLFSALVVENVATFSKDPDKVSNFLMYFTFLIGAIHLTVGHALNGLKKINSPQALAQLGWIGVVWGMFFLAGKLVLSKPLPGIALNLILGGAILIACFDNYLKGHFWKGFGATIGNLPLSIISSFGDVVSYLRLFAVGLAGSVVEVSFNNMALTGVDNLLKGIIAVLIILFGHSLNIALCMMSVIVHGIRLNMLEFSGHLGMQWTGQKYEPFRE